MLTPVERNELANELGDVVKQVTLAQMYVVVGRESDAIRLLAGARNAWAALGRFLQDAPGEYGD